MEKKKIAIIAIVAIIALVVVACLFYNLGANAGAESESVIIDNAVSEFEGAERSRQVEIYHQLQGKYESYKIGDKIEGDIIQKYENTLEDMQNQLTAMYDTKIAENTIENVNESNDSKSIKTASDNLGCLLITVEAEDVAIDTYSEKINNLINTYNNRLETIAANEKKEQEQLLEEVNDTYMNFLSCEFPDLMEYYIYDIDKDGIPELIILSGTCEADAMYHVYTYEELDDIYGVAFLGNFSGGHTYICGNSQNKSITAHYAHMGYEYADAISISGDHLVSKRILDEREVPMDEDYTEFDFCVPLQ